MTSYKTRFNRGVSLQRRSMSRGAAMVEAVVVLPVFLVLFIGVFYVRDQLIKRQEVETLVRSCAYIFSSNGCDEKTLPAMCEGVVRVDKKGGTAHQDLTEKLADLGNSAAKSGDSEGLIENMVAKLLTPAIEEAFGRSALAESSGEVKKPPLFSTREKKDEEVEGPLASLTEEPPQFVTIDSRLRLSCNLTRTTAVDVAKDAWNLVQGKGKEEE